MIIVAGVGTADHLNDELRIHKHLFVADRRAQILAILIYPANEIERRSEVHKRGSL
jgi:hypothetical protein